MKDNIMLNHFRLPALIFTLSLTITIGQSKKEDIWADDNFNGLEFRSIGPAFMSGRISDIAVHPEDNNTWYVSVGSGNVWKTENAGITWTPIFDDQGSYSIGCVTIDPNKSLLASSNSSKEKFVFPLPNPVL